jgi:SAM-dependent methyltransferase
MTRSPPHSEVITNLLNAVYPSFALLAGLQLDLFTHLEQKPLSARNLADKIGVQTYKLQPLLFSLVKASLINYKDSLFSNTSEANQYLVEGKPTYIGARNGLTSGNWKRMLDMAATIRAGKPPVAYDDPSSPDELMEVFRGLYPGAVADAKLLLDQFDFSDCKKLLDIGGGSGGLGITIAKANPHLIATIIDLPSVTPITKKFVGNENANDQIEIVAADAINDTLPGLYDVVVARHLFQVLSKKDAQALLKKIAKVVKPGGSLYIIGYILDNTRLAPSQAVDFNLVLITSSEYGEAYTEQGYEEWLRNAGFVGFTRGLISNGTSLISVNKPYEN